MAALAFHPSVAEAKPGSVKVTVLNLRSASSTPAELASLSARMRAGLAADHEVETVDPVRPLVEQGMKSWLRADKLLYDGIEAYGELRYAEAVTMLRESSEISASTFREYADISGPDRLRDAYLYLGLARLELGAGDDARQWFERAARTDPEYKPDPKNFSPTAVAAFTDAKATAGGPALEVSLARLDAMAKRIGADVVVTGGVAEETGGRRALQLVIADARRGVLTEQSVSTSGDSRDDLANAVDQAMPAVLAQIFDRPLPGPRRSDRARFFLGYQMLAIPDAKFDVLVTGAAQERYRWKNTLAVSGLAGGADAIRRGPFWTRGEFDYYLSQQLPRSGFQKGSPVSGKIDYQFGVGAAVHEVYARETGPWILTGGAGARADYALIVLRSQSSFVPTLALWGGPDLFGSFARRLGRSGFVQIRLGAEYDLGGREPGAWTLRPQLSGGTAF